MYRHVFKKLPDNTVRDVVTRQVILKQIANTNKTLLGRLSKLLLVIF
jgi:hypothetical protein